MFRHFDFRKTCRSSAAAEVGSSSDNGPLAPLWAPGAEPQGEAPSGNLTRARARIRAAWLISTKPLHRRYGQPAKRDCQAGTKRYVARHWGLTHSSHERRATGGRRGPNRPTRLHPRNVVNRLLAVPGGRDRRCHRKAHRINIRQFIREEAKAILLWGE
jgi:hypothetical protein